MFILQKFHGNMKRLAFILIFILWAGAAGAEGIRTAADLVAFAQAINNGEPTTQWRNEKGYVCLEADIDMSKVKKYKPISSFGGVFDGRGYKIMNWKTSGGLIDHLLEGGQVRNLTIAESCVLKAGNPTKEESFISFIVHRNDGLVENCINRGKITYKSPYAQASMYVGGVVGSNRNFVVKCSNYGDIVSTFVSTVQNPQIEIYLGGVVGGGYQKSMPKASVCWCDNYGDISYNGDVPKVFAGGVVGNAFKSTVKYCVNRGELSATTNTGEVAIKDKYAHIGGVCAFSRNDMIGCDNFGKVSSFGVHPASVGGVLGIPFSFMAVTDCINYGSVSLSNEASSSLGGVVGSTNRPVHIGNCENYGSVNFDGFCPDYGSRVGGIIGAVSTKQDATQAAYISGCVNYGSVFSGSGGNNYENDKAIHTGGIAGRIQGNRSNEVVVRDCANLGEVSSVTGKSGSLTALLTKTRVTGKYYNNFAESAEVRTDGVNVFGKVITPDGTPIPGAVVSDGRQCVATSEDGTYAMKSDLNETRFIFISLQSDYVAETFRSVPKTFRKVRRHEKAVKADFVLSLRKEKLDEYTMVMIGDPQMRGLGHDNSGERFRDVVLPDIENLKGDDGNFFAINLGDIVYNYMSGYDDWVDICSRSSFPMFNVIGNHDCDQNNLYDIRLGTGFYENFVCPAYYSFDMGDVHYVVLNTIMNDLMLFNGRGYWYGVDEKQLEWLKNDLKFVPKDKTLVVCSHSPLFINDNKSEKSCRNINELKSVLAQFTKVYAWAGHTHQNYGCNYVWEQGVIPSVQVARCNGALRTNREIAGDGTPNGYMVVNVKGGNMQWYYKSIGYERDYQMKVYSPTRTQDGYAKAVIWNYTPDFWSKPQWYENGVFVAELEQFKEPDLDYMDLFNSIEGLKGRELQYAKPVDSRFMFRIKPSEGVRKGEVRVTDNFGVTYTQSIEW